MTRQTTTILWLAAALGLWWWLRRPAGAVTLLPMPGAGDDVYRPTGAENYPYAGR